MPGMPSWIITISQQWLSTPLRRRGTTVIHLSSRRSMWTPTGFLLWSDVLLPASWIMRRLANQQAANCRLDSKTNVFYKPRRFLQRFLHTNLTCSVLSTWLAFTSALRLHVIGLWALKFTHLVRERQPLSRVSIQGGPKTAHQTHGYNSVKILTDFRKFFHFVVLW